MISKEHLEKFKRLYRIHFGKEISDQEASDKAMELVRLVECVYGPAKNLEKKTILADTILPQKE